MRGFCRTIEEANWESARKILSVMLSLLLAMSLCPGVAPLALAEEAAASAQEETDSLAGRADMGVREPAGLEDVDPSGDLAPVEDSVAVKDPAGAERGAEVDVHAGDGSFQDAGSAASDADGSAASADVLPAAGEEAADGATDEADVLEALADTDAEEVAEEREETSDADVSWYREGESAFTITTAAQLAGVSALSGEGVSFEGKAITLGADIDLSDYLAVAELVWVPIGSTTTPFSGTFNGAGHTISGIATTAANDNQGLFGVIKGAHISNLTVAGTVSGKANNGGIAGQVQGSASVLSSIVNCVNKASVSSTGNYTGGIVGSAGWVTIQGCVNLGSISGSYAGGIAGGNNNKNNLVIRGCCNRGNVGARTYVGGIVGDFYGNCSACSMEGNYSTGKVTGSSQNNRGVVVGRSGGKVTGSSNWGSSDNNGGYKAAGTGTVTGAALKTSAEMKAQDFVDALNAAGVQSWVLIPGMNDDYPIQEWQAPSNYLKSSWVTVDPAEAFFDEDPVKVAVSVESGSGPLASGVDYTSELIDPAGNAVDAIECGGTHTVRVTGQGAYVGVVNVPVRVRSDQITAEEVTLAKASAVYSGAAVDPGVKVVKDGDVLTAGVDYEVSYWRTEADGSMGAAVPSIVDAGTYTVLVRGKGDFRDKVEKTFEITSLALTATGTAAGLVTVPSQVPFSGEALSPNLTVKQTAPATVVLEEGRDYAVVIKDAEGSEVARTDEQAGARATIAQEGDYTLAVTGKGNYRGEATLAFSVLDPDADAWNGYIDASWYDARYDTFTLTKPAQLAGLAALVSGTVDTDGDGAINAAKDHLTFSGKTVRLGNNLNLNDHEWTMLIGSSASTAFSGTFDGAGYEIAGLNAQGGSKSGAGLFHTVNNATIKNLTVKGKAETSATSFSYAAAGVAMFAKSSVFDHVVSYVDVDGGYYAGGIVGKADAEGTAKSAMDFIACANYGSISNKFNNAGGIVGNIAGRASGTPQIYARITSCVNEGSISNSYGTSSTSYGVGGIVGSSTTMLEVEGCINNGTVTVSGKNNAGGIAGMLGTTTAKSPTVILSNCLNTGSVAATSDGSRAGGLVGMLASGGAARSSVSVGAVSSASNKNVGALIGVRYHPYNNYPLGEIRALRYVPAEGAGDLKAIGLAAGGSQDVQDESDAEDPDHAISLTSEQLATQDTVDALNGDGGAAWSLKDGALVNATSQVEPAVPDPSKRVSKITVSSETGDEIIDEPAGTLQMRALIEPDNALDASVTWSLDPLFSPLGGRASIDAATGLLTAERDGFVVVYATARDGSQVVGKKMIVLTNQYVELQSVDILDASGASVEGAQAITDEGQTLAFKAAVLPANATECDVTWSVVEGEGVIELETSVDDPNTVTVSPVKGGVATLRAAVVTEAGTLVCDEVTISVDPRLYFATVWQGNAEGKEVKIGHADRTNGYAGTGTSRDPYRYLVAPRITDQLFGNPSTGASSFWGTGQSTTASPAEFAIVFEQRESVAEDVDPREGALISSMAFDTIKNKNPGWTDFGGAHKPKIAPETAFDTSTGDLRVGFAWKGDFDNYFTSWDFTFDAEGLTSGLPSGKQAKPGDEVCLTYYGNHKSGQTVSASDFSINLDAQDDAVAFAVTATVGADGYVTFAGDQHVRYGGNYLFSIVEAGAVPVESIEVTSATGSTSLEGKSATLQLSARALPEDATNAQVFWSVESGATRVGVDQAGLVRVLPLATDGKAIVRASAADGSGVYGEITLTIGGLTEQAADLYVGNRSMGQRTESGRGTGSAEDPYVFPVKATVSSQTNANPYTAPSQFWGEAQSTTAAPAQFAVAFIEYYEGTSGPVKSSMTFDTITKKASGWTDFNSLAPRLSPVSATDDSTGDLRVAFAFKGSFDAYFSDWSYVLDVVGLTSGLAEEKRVEPGDTVVLTHYGNFLASQTSRGTNYSINFDETSGATGKAFEAVVNEDGYAVFSGDQAPSCGGNYVLTIGERAPIDPDIDDPLPGDKPDGENQSGGSLDDTPGDGHPSEAKPDASAAGARQPNRATGNVANGGPASAPRANSGTPLPGGAPVDVSAEDEPNGALDEELVPIDAALQDGQGLGRDAEAIGESETALAASGGAMQGHQGLDADQASRAPLTFALFGLAVLALAATYWLVTMRRKPTCDKEEGDAALAAEQ